MTVSEDRRLRAVAATGLAPAPDRTFDGLARAACAALHVPIALVSLLDAEQQFFPGACGMPSPLAEDRVLPLTETLCRMVVDGGRPLIFSDGPADPRVAENLMVAEFGVVAYIGLPLTADDGLVVGSLCAVALEARTWTAADLAIMEALAEACAAELRLRTERTRAEAAAERARRVGALATALGGTLSAEEISAILADQIQDAVDAQAFSLRLVHPDLGVARAVHLAGSPECYRERSFDLPLDQPSAVAEVVTTRQPVFVCSPQEYLQRYGDEASRNYEASRVGGLARLPLLVEGEIVGLLSVGYWKRKEFPPEERLFLTTVASLAAQALGRALRTERLRRLQSLSDLALSRLSLPELAGDLGDRLAGMLRASRVLLFVHEPQRLRLRPVGEPGPPVPLGCGVVGIAAAERRVVIVEDATELDDPSLRGLRSLAAAPLILDDQIVGAMVVGRDRPGPFAFSDVELIGQAAARVALAVDRCRAFEHQRELARTLQAALLPPVLPEIPGVRAASAHQAAGAEIDVGGDFYDVFALGDGTWLAVIGDVRGRGPAAAALTGLIRHTVHAVAAEERDPAAILARTNHLVFHDTGPEDFATVACVRIVPTPGRAEIVIASAGHCVPLILRASPAAVETVETNGMLLGAFEQLDLGRVHRTLWPGDVLLLHTDGLTDTLGAGERFGDRRLVEALHGLVGCTPEQVVDSIHGAVLQYGVGEREDDLAMLALGVVSTAEGAPVPLLSRAMTHQPQAAADARAAVAALDVPAHVREDLRLVVSELISNAVRHGQSGHDILLRVAKHGPRLRVEVRNSGVPFAVPDLADPMAETGRGLALVRAATARFGVGRERGRVLVWCEFDL